jgi:hypothetical protein
MYGNHLERDPRPPKARQNPSSPGKSATRPLDFAPARSVKFSKTTRISGPSFRRSVRFFTYSSTLSAHNFNTAPQPTFSWQVPAITNSNHLLQLSRLLRAFVPLCENLRAPTLNTLRLQKNILNRPRRPTCDLSLIDLIDPDRPQTTDHQHQSTSDRF